MFLEVQNLNLLSGVSPIKSKLTARGGPQEEGRKRHFVVLETAVDG
jgi:hypothetical protein